MQSVSRWRQPQTWVWLGMLAFLLWFGVSAWFRHANFYTSQFDLGNMDSVLWHTLHGKFFTMTYSTELVQATRLITHADFLLLAGTPFYLIWADPRMLMWLQIAVVASGVWPVFWLAKAWLGPRWGLLMSGIYLTFPHLLWAVIFDFHAVTLATPLLLWGFWAMREKRYWLYAASMLLALLSKEEVGLIIGLLGLYFLIRKKHRWISLTTIVIGMSWSLLMLGWAIPHARPEGGHFALWYYADFGDTPAQVLTGILTHPGLVASKFFGATGLAYVGALMWPVGFASILALPILAIALPAFGINLLSSNPNLHSIYYHYASTIIPFVLLSAMLGLHWLFRRFAVPPRSRIVLGIIILASAASAAWSWSPLPLTRHQGNALQVFRASPARADVAYVKKLVPANAAVSVTNNIGPQFTQREWTYTFPIGLDRADAAVVLLGDYFEIRTQEELRVTVTAMANDPAWKLVYQNHDLYYFTRVQAYSRIER